MTDSRDRLTEAMSALLWERGYAATSPNDVLALAGVGQGSMYHYFAGKHDLAVEALRNTVKARQGRATTLTAEGDPVDRLEQYLTLPRPGTKGCPVGRMTQDPDVVADPEMIGLVAQDFDYIAKIGAEVIKEAIDAGELPTSVVPEELALTMSAVLQGGFVLARAHDSQEPMDAAIHGLISLIDAARSSAEGVAK